MLLAVLSGFLVAAAAPWLAQLFRQHSGWALALLPASLFFYFLSLVPQLADGPQVVSYPWIPALGINLSFLVDGLSLLFALLISGIGTLIVAYAGRYLEGHRDLGRFYIFLLSFMASMLGLVLSNNLISMFVFWELTSITSYMLIGFNHEDEKARKSAQQGLFVTVGGGLALMTGLIMMASIGDSYELSELLGDNELFTSHALFAPMLILILLGTFTKSAQFPFHFWLPNAMAAPTPVSAYLHSATMVKAGVYLMARLNPALGDNELWMTLLGLFGGFTMFAGIFLALRSTGIKKVLAYSTIMALGTLTMLIGVGTEKAIAAAMVFLVAHSLYKGALFMVAGIIDHGTGSKDFLDTGGLRKAMPVTALFAGLAALSLAGVIPMFGFIAKELLFEAVLDAPALMQILLPLSLLSAIMVVAVAAIVGIKPWYGKLVQTSKTPHEASPALLVGPAVLAFTGLIFGFAASQVENSLLGGAISAVHGSQVDTGLALWHGINAPLLMSIASLVIGLLLYRYWTAFRHLTGFTELLSRFGPERGYEALMNGLVTVSNWQTRLLQNGYLRYYLIIILLTTVSMVALVLTLNHDAIRIHMDLSGIRLHEYAVILTLTLSVLMAVTTGSRLGAVASLGAFGFTVALTYVLFSAPDLGITQILVETLTVILLVLVLFRLPGFLKFSPMGLRLRDAGVALSVGVTMTVLILIAGGTQYHESISSWHIAESQPSGYGRNIVNVILVDFRALDTLGEIFVLALAATGVFAMIKLRAEDRSR